MVFEMVGGRDGWGMVGGNERGEMTGNGYAKFSVRDNDKKNHWEIDTLDGYKERDIC